MPILVPAVGEEKLLTTGLFVSCINVSSSLIFDSILNFLFDMLLIVCYVMQIFVYSIAWSSWVIIYENLIIY